MLRGDSEDPVGDFVAINQELELFNPKLADKLQVVVVNKIDIPEVRDKLEELTKRIKQVSGHTRVMGISAATGERVKELMQRVRKVVESLPQQSDFELFTEEEDRVNFDEQSSDKFEVFTDDRFPGQFRVVGDKIEKVHTASPDQAVLQCNCLPPVFLSLLSVDLHPFDLTFSHNLSFSLFVSFRLLSPHTPPSRFILLHCAYSALLSRAGGGDHELGLLRVRRPVPAHPGRQRHH